MRIRRKIKRRDVKTVAPSFFLAKTLNENELANVACGPDLKITPGKRRVEARDARPDVKSAARCEKKPRGGKEGKAEKASRSLLGDGTRRFFQVGEEVRVGFRDAARVFDFDALNAKTREREAHRHSVVVVSRDARAV